jgi:hypothetical protein
MGITEVLRRSSGVTPFAPGFPPLNCANLDSTTMSTSAPTVPESLSSDPTAPPKADPLSTAVAAAAEILAAVECVEDEL